MEERQRDEYGMEEVDGLFSSPEKSPAEENGFSHADDTAGSEMSIEDGETLPRDEGVNISSGLATDMYFLEKQTMRRDLWTFSAPLITRATITGHPALNPQPKPLGGRPSCAPPRMTEKIS